MRPRQNLIDIFSTFLKFAEDRFNSWAADARLHRSMEQQLKTVQKSETSEQFWSLYWHRIWQQQLKLEAPSEHSTNTPVDKSVDESVNQSTVKRRLAENHLIAYLQETCYWTARKTSESGFANPQSSLADLFQIAIAQVNRVLKGFDSSQGSNLADYASVAFKSIIRDILRQRRETDICSDWALLRKLSQRRFRESLENAGLSANQIEQYLLAWNCFKIVYVPDRATGTRQLAKPDGAIWEAIAQLYSQERRKQPGFSGSNHPPATLEQWLVSSAKWARSYLYPRLEPIPKRPDDSQVIEIDIPDVAPDPLTAQIIGEEIEHRYHQQVQLNQVLEEAIAKMKPDLQHLLELYYLQGCTQQQIAQTLETKQYTVSRRLTKAREILLKALVQWSQDMTQTPLTPDTIQQMSLLLEEWMKNHAIDSLHNSTPGS
ncbi:MAG: sigma-70 family RNA polymerase sigma factor [Microcoleaceae cyanobacterium]